MTHLTVLGNIPKVNCFGGSFGLFIVTIPFTSSFTTASLYPPSFSDWLSGRHLTMTFTLSSFPFSPILNLTHFDREKNFQNFTRRIRFILNWDCTWPESRSLLFAMYQRPHATKYETRSKALEEYDETGRDEKRKAEQK